jgi:hypothetical protein
MRVCLGLVFALVLPIWADDDPLPNFNAPVDNSPLNADKVNKNMGATLFQAKSLWDEDSVAVAQRLGWPEESKTSTQSSYRLYPSATAPVIIFGAQAYSCVLYATNGKPTEASIVFVNIGDYDWDKKFVEEYKKLKRIDTSVATSTPEMAPTTSPDGPTPNSTGPPPSPLDGLNLSSDDRADIDKKVHYDFQKDLKQTAQTITDALTKLFGDPQFVGFGGGTETREQVRRWDWQGHSFLLSNPRDTYVSLRIVPTTFADNYGKADNVSHEDLKALLLQRVKQDPSGDVVVTDIPMVDQGPKGYCVPATWERYLRFLGIPADMYVLAMAAGSNMNGTDTAAMVQNVDSLVTLYHRRIDDFSGDLDLKMIAKNIDKGLPLMWGCSIHIPFERALSRRQAERNAVTDWQKWASDLAARDDDEIQREITGAQTAGLHQRMIIGYNGTTSEIAISDSWSKAFAIRWLTLKEANAINEGQVYVIAP